MTGDEARWRDYRRRLTITAAAWAVPPVLILVSGVGGTLNVILVTLWLLAFTVSMVWLFSWRCPRCGNWFFIKIPNNRPFTRACVHCGLPKWAVRDPSSSAGDGPGNAERP